jgi:hypothetical protein
MRMIRNVLMASFLLANKGLTIFQLNSASDLLMMTLLGSLA